MIASHFPISTKTAARQTVGNKALWGTSTRQDNAMATREQPQRLLKREVNYFEENPLKGLTEKKRGAETAPKASCVPRVLHTFSQVGATY